MLLPVLALYVDQITDATPLSIGVALGIYGLTQAFFQIPLGALSDSVGRKPIIACGLVLYIAGALFGATANSIWTIIVGRAIQGCGAVSGATLALAADLCRENQRTKITAAIGSSIGIAFSVAFVLGPFLDTTFSLSGVFIITAILGLVALCILIWLTPSPVKTCSNPRLPTLETFLLPDLRVLFAGVFILHAVLAANFISVPVAMVESLSIGVADQWRLYLVIISSSIILVAYPIRSFSKDTGNDRQFRIAIAVLGFSEVCLSLFWHDFGFIAALIIFFTAFNYLEAIMPTIVSQKAPVAGRGAALGTYATCQFLGMFVGGLVGGAVAELLATKWVHLFAALLIVLWYWLTVSQKQRKIFTGQV